MPLIDKATGRELKEGDEVECGRTHAHISGLDAVHKRVFLFPDRGEPFAVGPAAIGAEFKP